MIVRTSDGREITGSHCLMSIGSIPNTKDLQLESQGVDVTPSGHIHVDRVSRTNVSCLLYTSDAADDIALV